jgi:hypothetical protein
VKFLNLQALCLLAALYSYAAVAAFYPVNRGMVNQATYVATAAGTTTAVASSNQVYVFTGVTTQSLRLPNATGLPVDWWYEVVNNSTDAVTVQDSTGATITTVAAGRAGKVLLRNKTTAAGTWTNHVGAAVADLDNYFTKSEFIDDSTGVADAGKPIKTNASGFLDASFLASLNAGITQLTGDVTAGPGTGSQAATVASVGGSSAANVAAAEALANAATDANTAGAIVRRDGSGNFSAGTITGALTGNVTGNLTGNVTGNASTATALAANPADCGAGTKATAIAANGDLTCSAVSLTAAADVSGTLPIANGGTGQTSATDAFNALSPMTTLGDTIYGGASGAGTRLAGNTTTSKRFLIQTGDGANSAAPSWGSIATSDVVLVTTSAIAAGASVPIDWNVLVGQGGVYTRTLAANTVFTFANPRAGQAIIVSVTNTASNYTAAFSDARLKWSGNVAPTQTTGAKTDVYTFVYDGTNIYGSVVQNF